MYITHVYAKIQLGSLKNLSNPSSFAFWSSLAVCTATHLYFALLPLGFFLLLENPTKPLSPGDQPHWGDLNTCNNGLYVLSRIEDLQNLH